jgi:hypothetical protein
MSGVPRRSSAAAAAAVLWAVACLWVAFAWRAGVSLVIRYDVPSPPAIVQGLYETEGEPNREAFAWTGEQVRLRLRDLDRRMPWTVSLVVQAARPTGLPRPVVTIAVDGVTTTRTELGDDVTTLTAALPARSRAGAAVDVSISPTFVPGAGDGRALGVQWRGARFRASGWPRPPWIAIAMAVATAVCVTLLAAAAAWQPLVIGLVLLTGVVQAWLFAFGSASFGGYPVWSVTWAGPVLVVGAVVCRLVRHRSDSRAWQAAVAMAAVALVLQGWMLNHPSMTQGDSGFHAHKFNDVLAGRYFFTSGAPGGQFPYPIALYIAALPFARLVPDEMWLLRAICAVAHAVAGLAVFAFVRRSGPPGRALWAEAFFFVVPAGFHALAVAYLTNSFGQSMSVVALGVVAAWPFDRRPRLGAMWLALAALVAALSHMSSFVLLISTLGVYVLLGLRRAGRDATVAPVAAGALMAVTLAVAGFYAHFPETYRALLHRPVATSPGPTAAPPPLMRDEAHQTQFVPGWDALRVRLAAVPRYVLRYFGWWLPLLALVGAIGWRALPRGAASRALAAWLMTCAVFFVLGQLTPFDVRYYLWASPALAILGALAMPPRWTASPRERGPRLVGAVGLVLGVIYWISWLGPSA